MNSRDLVDWVVIGASVLSSFSILATIFVYIWQKNNNKKDRELTLNAREERNEIYDIIS